MIIFPAIDIKEGRVVRLLQGKFDQVTQYDDDPVSMALKWESIGARWLHLVDLDGAKTGTMRNKDIVIRIAQSISIPVEVGGGIRTEKTIDSLLRNGIERVILGTKVIDNLEFLGRMIDRYSDKIAVSLDCSNGFVAGHGWTKTTDIRAIDLVKKLEEKGLSYLIYTDIATDGMLSGPNFKALDELCDATNIPIIASGGISCIEDIKKLITFQKKGIIGAITGKAIYEGTLDLKEALKLC